MHELRFCLKPHGWLFLAVPSCAEDLLIFPSHRLYGPARLPMLLHGYTLVARVFDGRLVEGGLSTASSSPRLFLPDCRLLLSALPGQPHGCTGCAKGSSREPWCNKTACDGLAPDECLRCSNHQHVLVLTKG